jgi:hypothetical protein
LDTSSLTNAWEAFFEESGTFSIEDLNKEGWLSVEQVIQKIQIPRTTVDYMLIKKGFEKKKFKIAFSGTKRMMNFYRPSKKKREENDPLPL